MGEALTFDEEIGRGSTSVVFRGTWGRGRKIAVAIKIFSRDITIKATEKELKLMCSLNYKSSEAVRCLS